MLPNITVHEFKSLPPYQRDAIYARENGAPDIIYIDAFTRAFTEESPRVIQGRRSSRLSPLGSTLLSVALVVIIAVLVLRFPW